jgi:hypothetical protein
MAFFIAVQRVIYNEFLGRVFGDVLQGFGLY